MTKNKSSKRLSWQLCKPVIASALAVGGVFNLVAVVLAEGTAAGTQITNTATATYRDPDGTPQTSTSNTVVVEIAEIAGITVVNTAASESPTNSDGDNVVEPGEEAAFVFTITNVGNDETDISLPAVADFSGPVDSVVSILADLDGDGTFETPITSRTDIEDVQPGESFEVQVIVATSTSAQTDDLISVQYGDTPGDGQNQPYDSSGGSVFTDDNDTTDAASPTGAAGVDTDPLVADTPGETDSEAGPEGPANGEREASDTASLTVGEIPLEQPLVELKKTVSAYSDGGTPATVVDDTITYDLEVDVLEQVDVPTGSNAIPADLQAITINGLGTKHVLISDAVPDGTSLSAATPPVAPAGWQVVYTADPVTTNALEASWSATAPATPTRVGFIGPANTAIAMTDPALGGFKITVVTDQFADPTASPLTVSNIAQVFGSGVVDDPLTPEDETLTYPVMDESGDDTPSNYDPTTDTYSNFNPDVVDDPTTPLPEGFTPDDGYIDDPTDLLRTGIAEEITKDDTDPEDLDDPTKPLDPIDDNNGDNTDGTGEAIVVELSPEPEQDLLNGPDGSPDAVGPTGTNDDFTNKSAPFSDGDPPVVEFTNTVDNASTEDGWVRLEPTAPADPTDLPAGTTATIIAPDGTRVEYTYDGTTWAKTNPADPDIIVPVRADDGVPGGDDEFDYGVEIDLPNDPANITELDSFPVPIEATFAGVSAVLAEDAAGANDGIDPTDISDVLDVSTTQNTTIDRIYTGFLELVKTAQVVQGDGPPVAGDPAPGNHIVYQVEYTNISEPEIAPMQGNVLLTASDLVIIEDGTEQGCDPTDTTLNNWAYDNDANGDIDTRHVPSSVDLTNLDSGSTGSVVFYSGDQACNGTDPDFNPDTATPSSELSGTTQNTDTTAYAFDIEGDIDPLESGYVEFERRIN